MDTKMVIVIRRDLKMGRGKEIAQGAHAAMMFMARRAIAGRRYAKGYLVEYSDAENAWLDSGTRKITCQVADETELFAVVNAARAVGVRAEVVCDAGRTQFGGVPTYTAAAIGPDWDANIDPVTGNLKLY